VLVRRGRLGVAAAAAGAGLLLTVPGPAGAAVAPPPSDSAPAVPASALWPSAASATTAVPYASAQARISALLPRRVAALPALDRAPGIYVSDAATGAVAYRTRALTPMRGASTMKLLTAATTLRLMGADSTFPTVVRTGRSAREVVLVGGGNPLLTSAQLGTLASRTAARLAALAPPAPAAGPTAPVPLRFTVRLDDARYARPTPASGWRSGYLPYEVAPVRPLIRDLRNSWDGAGSAARYFASRVDAALKKRLGARTDLAPAVSYGGRLIAPVASTVVSEIAGATTGEILRYMLLVSDNDVAEMMFRNNALASGRPGSWAGGVAAARETLTALGIDASSWTVRDGSGLSREDRMTAAGLAALLAAAASPEHPELAPLRGYLPVAGVSGTLSTLYHRYDTAPTRCARGKVWGKTGSLFDTIALAGYARGSDSRLKVYVAFVHRTRMAYSGLTVRRSVDRIAATATGCY
jgi:D-alanyl-D-alanine carboxypeptidase/D-alanyl-D-alanine-endopeptidase (penicillin-binding protein 4)